MSDYQIFTLGFLSCVFWLILSEICRYKYRRCDSKIYDIKGILFIMFACLSLYLISALRYRVGIDDEAYRTGFETTNTPDRIASYYEPGFGLICYLCNSLFRDYQAMIFVTAIATGALLFKSIYRDAGLLVLCLFGVISENYYFMSFTVIRQFLAISIALLSIPAIYNRNLIKSAIIILIATSIHYTAITFFALYFLYKFASNQKVLFLLVFICILLIMVFTNLEYIVELLLSNMVIFRDTYGQLEYSDEKKNIKEILILLPYVIVFLWYRKKLIAENPVNSLYLWMFCLLLITKIIGFYQPFLSRVHYYYSFANPILMSYIPKVVPRHLRLLSYILICILFSYEVYLIIYYQGDDFLPYRSIFSKI